MSPAPSSTQSLSMPVLLRPPPHLIFSFKLSLALLLFSSLLE